MIMLKQIIVFVFFSFGRKRSFMNVFFFFSLKKTAKKQQHGKLIITAAENE